jgi:hypothetical protein
MSETLKAIIFDGLTGQAIERPLTVEEITNRERIEIEFLELQAEAQAKADARTSALAKLADLGLTQDEINAL